ncbi:6-phosphogluconate phosphatase [Pseudovibrio japonicus]|uniref:6-phosphogluconate phosphatase n=1 Tax=Pseudovibrio japonicus TaxID=366534 RepID=A0ABQ3E9U0_9HYPH|nr:HAD-IA family hydrolase [Pseudovibrio japonicus]GHB27952.1 6-phosphogluconate phosphatase [Pseudovibrio japonicus]
MDGCLIFDLDGTLVDSEPLCSQAFLDLLPEIELPLVDLMRRFRGRKLSCILDDLEGIIGRRLPVGFEADYRAQVEHLFNTELVAFPEVSEALCEISLPMCIASSGPRAKIESALEKTDLKRFFGPRIFSSYDVGIWKPDPGLFLHAAREMRVSPERCTVIEDSEVGVRAAKSAGMNVLKFCEGADPEIGTATFDSYSELPERLLTSFAVGERV